MKILLIQPTGDKRGHYGIYTSHVCQELARQGNDVTFFTNRVHPEEYIKEKQLFHVHEHKAPQYDFKKFDEAKSNRPLYYNWGYIRNCWVILKAGLKFAKGKDFDVIQIFDCEYSIASILIRLYSKGLPPIALMVNAPNFGYSKYTGSFVIKVYKEVQKRFLKALLGKKIKGVNMLGEFHRTEFRKQFNLPESFPIAVIYDGADSPEVRLSKKEAREKLHINHEGTLFLFFGMLRKDKGIEYLIEAVSLIKDLPFKVLMAGSLFDYKKEDIMGLFEKFGVTDKFISHFDYIDHKDMYNYFFAGDVLVLPYLQLYTGGSGPLLKEAAICKVPAIVSDVSEMGPLVKKYDMGFAVKAEDPKVLAEAMKKFMSLSKEEQVTLGEHAFRAANTWAKMGKEYTAFYESL